MRKFIAATAIVAAGVGVAGVASAEPPERTEDWVCNGMPTEIEIHGRMGIIDGQKYLAHNLTINGVFDPVAPGAPNETFSDTQWSSGRTGGLDCRDTQTFTDEEGTTTVVLRLNAIAIGKP
jgi:hypothetical protein